MVGTEESFQRRDMEHKKSNEKMIKACDRTTREKN